MTVIKEWNATTSTWDLVLPGPQGAKGDTGATGATGPTGATGATGANPLPDDDQLVLSYQVFS